MAPSTTKATPSQRRVPSPLSKVSTHSSTARSGKTSKPTLIIRLKISSSRLSEVSHDSPSSDIDQVKDASPAAQLKIESKHSADSSSQTPDAPTPKPASEDDSLTAKTDAKVDPTALNPGVKRELGSVVKGDPKSKARPGPKKKAKLEGSNGTAEVVHRRTGAGAAHKLGPKANQGAINAGLRALDRTGRPCRKWQKGGFKLKSFTGHSWALPSWSAPPKPLTAEGDSTLSNTGSKSASKDLGSNSNVDSDSTPHAANGIDGASSPAPPLAVTA